MKAHLATAACVLACLLVAACGSARTTQPGLTRADRSNPAAPTATATPAVAAVPAAAAGNQKLAVAEAKRLLALVPVPAHSTLLQPVPGDLSIPALWGPPATSTVDRTRSWRLALPVTTAEHWLAAHAPAGLRLEVAEQVDGAPASGYVYTGPASTAWDSAELQIKVAPADAGAAVVMRADAQVVWLDPVPVRDTARGKRLRVLADAACPASDEGVVGVVNPSRDLARELVPAGKPSRGLECFYGGSIHGPAWRLHPQLRLTAGQAQRAAATMARRPLSHPLGEALFCPVDDGSAELIALSYPNQPDVDLWVQLTGCGGVSNGYITTTR